MKNIKRDKLVIILEDKFKYTTDILADKIIELFDETIDEDVHKKEESILKPLIAPIIWSLVFFTFFVFCYNMFLK